jgi:hypothetical protein
MDQRPGGPRFSCGLAIGIGQTHQLTAAGPAHLACPRP